MASQEEKVSSEVKDPSLELRITKALEKIALNTEAIAMFLENLNVEDWDERLQWYLSMFKEAYLDDKLETKK